MSEITFSGNHSHTIDAKNRFFIPAQYRATLGTDIILVQSPDKEAPCILIYTKEYWESLCRNVENLPPSPSTRKIQRRLLYSAQPVELDKTGRIALSKEFKEFAAIDKDIILVGTGVRIEIWAADMWKRQLTDDDDIDEQSVDVYNSLPF